MTYSYNPSNFQLNKHFSLLNIAWIPEQVRYDKFCFTFDWNIVRKGAEGGEGVIWHFG